MNPSKSLLRPLPLFAGGLLFCLPVAFAAPGGNGNGTGVGTAAATSGGHVAAPAAHSSGAAVGVSRLAAGASGGLRSGVGLATAPRTGTLGNAGFNRSSSGMYSTTVLGVNQRAALARTSLPTPTVHNAWTDPASLRVNGNRVGNNLYPGAYGYAANRSSNANFRHGNNGSRGRHRYYYNNFPYAVYYPYLYNNFGYYGGYGSLGYDGGVADYAGSITENPNSDLGAPDFTSTPNNYYSYAAPDQGPQGSADHDAPALPPPLPDAPAVGPQAPAASDRSTGAPQGPDSLVEAVQSELVRRGYFEGQPDSMYTPATREAIRRFQTDQRLPTTGRINEATLHALHLD